MPGSGERMSAGIACVTRGIYRSALPRRKDLVEFKRVGGVAVVDLTQRERPSQLRWCAQLGLTYMKLPTPYEGYDATSIAGRILALGVPVLFHCFHGRDRTGAVAKEIIRLCSS